MRATFGGIRRERPKRTLKDDPEFQVYQRTVEEEMARLDRRTMYAAGIFLVIGFVLGWFIA